MRIIEVYKADLLNGTGLRNVYFFSGCTHHCPGCFQAWTADPMCEQSREWTEEDYQQLIKDTQLEYIEGITLSGGDPFSPWNEKDIFELCKRFKRDLPEKTIWVYTGFTWEQVEHNPSLREILPYIDVLCDGPFIESLKSPQKLWVGSSNQRVIDVQKSLQENKIIEYEIGKNGEKENP